MMSSGVPLVQSFEIVGRGHENPKMQELILGIKGDVEAGNHLADALAKYPLYFDTLYVYLIFGGIGGGGYLLIQAKKRIKPFRHFIERISLKAPVFGDILVKATIARFSRTLATMFAAGVPLVEAMDSVARAAGNIVYAEGIYKMRGGVATDTQLQAAMREANLFPNMVVQMVAIGEESGSIDHMLGKVADFYEEEVDNAIDAMSSLMEPPIWQSWV